MPTTLSRQVEVVAERVNVAQADGPDAVASYIEALGRRHALRLTARAERQSHREPGDG